MLRTMNLPLAAYADGLKTAARLVDEGDVGGALLVLEAVLTQVVVTEAVLPLPNLRAEFLLLAAEERLTSEATEEDRAEAERLLDDAREQIELGRAYGYGTRRDYRALLDEIDRIEDEVRGAPVARAFENVRGRLARLFD